MKNIAAAPAALLLLMGAPALADEVISTHSGESPTPEAPSMPTRGPDRDQRQANGDWARKVMAGQPTVEDGDDARRCRPANDGKPHGEVWVGVGSRGYKEVGGVVTQPIGDCAEVTVAVSRTEGGGPRRRHR